MVARYRVGDEVLAWDNGEYRRAVIMELAPYRKGGCMGYYVRWLDVPQMPDGIIPSQGGWEPEHYLKPART